MWISYVGMSICVFFGITAVAILTLQYRRQSRAIREMLQSILLIPPCANCNHIAPHTRSTAGGGPNDPYDGCTYPGCNCGYYSPKLPT
jgi:hypothetical protein